MKKAIYLLSIILIFTAYDVYAENGHSHELVKEKVSASDDQPGLIQISLEGQKAAGIEVKVLKPTTLPIYISAPGEIIPNTNLTTIVTPRVPAQLLQRFVNVGDHVLKGQALAKLSSIEMARAQANILLSRKEWLRVKELGPRAVSAKRYQTVESAYQQAYSKLLAYGMTNSQLESFIKQNDVNKSNGEFTLNSNRKGTIYSSNFTEGQMIEPGKVLYKVVDEKSLWVDARLSRGESTSIKKNATAIVQTEHDKFPAKVLQIHHKLDEKTRTRVVRLEVFNKLDQLHPGEFVSCLIQAGKTRPVLAVNQNALIRTQDGDMAVYIEVKPNHFQAKEVEVLKKIGSWRVIKGITSGAKIVSKGVFFVHSEGLKSGFSTHNH